MINFFIVSISFLASIFNFSPLVAPEALDSANIPVIHQITPMPGIGPENEASDSENQVHVLYFYSEDCPHCQEVYTDVVEPLMNKYEEQLDVRLLKIDQPEYYELLISAEEHFSVLPEERGLPTTILGDSIFIGEEQNRSQLTSSIESAITSAFYDWPAIPGLDPENLSNNNPVFVEEGYCSEDNPDACAVDEPIYAAYFYQVGCQVCSRVEADIKYLQNKYPQFMVIEYNIYDDAALADWLARRVDREDDIHSPALFIGDQAWIGEEEITPAAIETALKEYSDSGSEKFWDGSDLEAAESAMVDRFRSMGWLAVVFAGLIDGLNPCAFATLVFFISYLTLSGHKGREVLSVGLAFTLGVFLAYLGIGLGFYKVLDLLGGILTALSRWVYILTAVLCFTLAVFSFLDYRKARKGEIGDMALNLPHGLRMRINATIRKSRDSQAFIGTAFISGLVISFLELACTGQIYLPTIIFVSSIPELRLKAFAFLLIYNLLFILPLVVVFILAFYGTSSADLKNSLERHAASVKLGMVILFLGLGSWLVYSLVT